MTIRPRLLSTGLLALALAACSPSGTASPSPSASAPGPSASPSGGPSAVPFESPSGVPSQGSACPVVGQNGALSSDRVTDIRIESTPTADLVTFIFGTKSNAPLSPTGKLSAIEPPFSDGGSGEPVDVPGAHYVEIRLEGILFSNDDGTDAYQGEYRYDVTLPALQALVNVDAFEGHFTWIAGYDGFGCVTLLPNAAAGTFTVSFGH